MEQLLKEIKLSYVDSRIDEVLLHPGAPSTPYTFHFTQNEEFFLRFDTEYSVPSFKIHHDVRKLQPGEEYIGKLKTVLEQLVLLCPGVFEDVSYYFDPAEIFKPCFYRIDSLEGCNYLYLLHIDLSFKPSLHRALSGADNDSSPSYSTSLLFLESEYIPLERIERGIDTVSSLTIHQIVSSTWVGERGRGYSIQGIWMDRELTKFLSRLFLPPGKRMYPYFPFTCRYRTLCLSTVHLSAEGRALLLPLLHNAFRFILPHMGSIEADLRESEFSEDLPSFQKLKNHVPSEWLSVWSPCRLNAYINGDNRKEWQLDFSST